MKRLAVIAVLLVAQIASATPFAEAPPAEAPVAPPQLEVVPVSAQADELVMNDLLYPLEEKETGRSRFSRGRMPATERRVRILDEVARHDALGAKFIRFAVDERHGIDAFSESANWQQATITGCVYLDRKQVFVKKGEQYRPASFLLGKKVKAAGVLTCRGEERVAKR
jgi:hypothetical protein